MLLRLLFILAVCSIARAQVTATFTVRLPDTSTASFKADLEYIDRPLTVTNFMLLGGLEDEKWLGPAANQTITGIGIYQDQPGGFQRANMQIRPLANTPGGLNKYSVSYLGVDPTFGLPVDIGTIELVGNPQTEMVDDPANPRWRLKKEIVNQVERFVLTLIYKHSWLDSRTGLTREDPFYRNLPFTRVEPGKRIFTGAASSSPLGGPGYVIQDELLNSFSNEDNPWGAPFNEQFVLAMDSFAPNTSGSRFFITGINREGADDRWTGNYTDFGQVLLNGGNRALVQSLVDIQASQLSGIRLVNITFEVSGRAGQIFFPHLVQDILMPEAPEHSTLPMKISKNAEGNVELSTFLLPREQAVYMASTNLQNLLSTSFNGTGNNTSEAKFFATEIEPINQRLFFYPFITRHKIWPSTEDLPSLAGRILEFDEIRILDRNPDPDDPPPAVPRDFKLDFTSSRLIFRGQEYQFTATYDNTQGPYIATISLQDMPDVLPLETIRLYFDRQLGNANPLRRFEALEPAEPLVIPDLPPGFPLPPNLVFNPKFSGVWKLTN